MSNKKVFVIGLDGGTFTVVEPMIKKGLLPNIAKLMEKGSWGKLESTIPHNTPCAWPSFMTGKNPGKHGIFHFFGSKADSYEGYLVNANSIRTETLWQLLGSSGKKVGLVDIPVTYPPVEVNGSLISGIPLPPSGKVFTYPPELYAELIRECGDFPHEDVVIKNFYSGNISEALKQLYIFTENRLRATLYLMEKYPWDFFMVVFRGTDLVGHYGARFWDSGYCERHPEETAKYNQLIPQYYEAVDRAIGKIIERLDDNCRVIVMSDHGMGPLKKHFYLNKWLMDNGLLKLKKFRKLRSYYLAFPKYSLAHILQKLRLRLLTYLLPGILRNKCIPLPRIRRKAHPAHQINWKKTKAFSLWTSGEGIIRLNVKGKTPQGIIQDDKEYEEIRNYIIDRLNALRDPETGAKVIDKAFKREEIYSGPFVDEAPDILFIMDETGYASWSELGTKETFLCKDSDFFGPHRLHGMFIMQGKDIREGLKLSNARIIDLAPTILYLLDLPVPSDMDGRVLEECIESSFKASNPIKYRKERSSRNEEETVEPVFSADDRKLIEEQLRGLGYIS